MYDVVTIGSASRDIFFITNKAKIIDEPSILEDRIIAFPLGAKVSIEESCFSNGGGACNATVSFCRLGLTVAPYMNVGNDEMGEQIVFDMLQEGAASDLIWVDEQLRTATSLIIIPKGSGERTVLFYSGANRGIGILDWNKVNNTSWFYVSPLSRQAPHLLQQIVEYANENKIMIANNPGMGQIEQGIDFMKPIMEKLDIFIVNDIEAAVLLSSKDPSLEHTEHKDLAPLLQEFGPKIVVVTCGADGSYCYDGSKLYYQQALSTEVVDPTGAGDAFGSTFVACRILERSIEDAMLIAAINAASVVSYIGAHEGLLELREIEKRISQSGKNPTKGFEETA